MKDKNNHSCEYILYLSEEGAREFNRLLEEEMEKYKPNIISYTDSPKNTKNKKKAILNRLKDKAKYKAVRRYYNY